MSHHPKPFKHSNTITLRKPQKPSYAVAKAYRPIALLNTLGKTLEKIVATRLSTLAEEHNLLPATQMGARPNRSTTTALELLTKQIRTVWARSDKLVATLLSLDISGAFDQVPHERLLHNMRNTGIPDWVTTYIRCYLTDRTTSLVLGTYKDGARPTKTGIPQGSALSPILFLFFSATLLPQLNTDRTTAIGFVDDTNILTFSKSTEENCRKLERAHEMCVQWATTHGAQFAPDKYQLIHFTPRLKKFNLQATINVPGFQGGPSPAIRMLGVHLDSRLKWGPHVRQTQAKAWSQACAVTRISQSTWGATFARARQIYSSVVRPTITYGCEIWYDPDDRRIGRNKLIYPLQVTQNKCLRSISGAYRSTDTQVLEHEASIPPLDLQLEKLVTANALKTVDSKHSEAIEAACEDIKTQALALYQTRLLRPTTRMERLRLRAQGAMQTTNSPEKLLRSAWAERWRAYTLQRQARRQQCSTAQQNIWQFRQDRLHRGLRKAESTVTTLLRTEHIGLNDYLRRRHVPGYSSECECGWHCQSVKHIVLFCPRFARDRDKLLQDASTSDLKTMLSTTTGIKAVTRWFIEQEILTQFSLAREAQHADTSRPRRAGRRAGIDTDDV